MRLGRCLVLAALALAACSTVRVAVPVLRPAEINLRGKQELVIGDFRGPAAPRINQLLKESIVSSGRFKLVERQHMDSVLAELSISQSDLADPSQQRKLGKMMTGSILVMAKVDRSAYREDRDSRQEKCTKQDKNKKPVEYKCVRNVRSGKAEVAVAFDVIDIETGENLKPKLVTCRQSSSTSAIDDDPPSIDGNAMLQACQQQVIADFMKSIAPWRDVVQAPFLKDGDVPQLEMGINYAERGEWDEAIRQFRSAVDFVGSKAGLDAEVVAKAHWDLGLAYEYTSRFDEAIAETKKAYEMTMNTEFLAEIDNIKRLRADQAKLEEQIGEGE